MCDVSCCAVLCPAALCCAVLCPQVDKILDSFYDYMDDRDRWHEAGVVKVRGVQQQLCV
jgi:hypothetical protein